MEVFIYGGKWKSVSEKLVEIKTEISQMENNLNICGFLLQKLCCHTRLLCLWVWWVILGRKDGYLT